MKWLRVVAVISILGFCYWCYKQGERVGYTEAIVSQQEHVLEQQNRAVDRARKEWELTQSSTTAEVIVEEKIVEKIRVIEKMVPEVIEKIVEVTPDCADLGPDFQRVFNQAITAGDSGEIGSPHPSP